MTVAELRALLETLPERFDNTEVTFHGPAGLCHVGVIELDRRKWRRDPHNELWDDVPDERLERKLRIGGTWDRTLWFNEPPEWRLEGWWPKEAAEIGLIEP